MKCKKAFAWLLTLCLVLTLFPATALTASASGTKTITVGVITYLNLDTSNYHVHYWGGATTGDADCTSLNQTTSKSVGNAYWNNDAQTFNLYTAEIPADATGFKVFNGDTWFGTSDGDATTKNQAFVFEYGGNYLAQYDYVAPTYGVTADPAVPNGTVAVDKATAAQGETVTVTATPNAGYQLNQITVDGAAITGNTFVMPDHAVTVSAIFILIPNLDEHKLYPTYTYIRGTGGAGNGEGPDSLLDNKSSTKWCVIGFSSKTPVYIEFSATEAFVPLGYVLTTANDSANDSGARNPTSWILKGKLTDSDTEPWTVLATVTNNTTIPAANYTDVVFTLSNPTLCKYFRWEISAIKGGDNCFQMADLKFFGEDAVVEHFAAAAATCTQVGYRHECWYNVITGVYYADENCTAPLDAATLLLPMGNHTPVEHPAVAAGLNTDGNIQYWVCSACGKVFSDAACTTEITQADTVVNGFLPYLDADGTTKYTDSNYKVITETDTELGAANTTTWYVVKQDVTINNNRISVHGDVRLILCDGATFSHNKGINVFRGDSLTVYAQSTGSSMGALRQTGNSDYYYAGIGGYYTNTPHHPGTITINGGTVVARGGSYSSGIGGGQYGQAGVITINGGSVTATGGIYGSGIGRGDGAGQADSVPESITITGGVVSATGGQGAAGIGSGKGGRSVAIITITGGQVTATAGSAYSGARGVGIGPGGTPSSYDTFSAITLGWTDSANDFIQSSGFSSSCTYTFSQAFVIQETGERATVENILGGGKLIPKLNSMDADLAYATVSGVDSVYRYTGQDIAVTPSLTDVNGAALTEDTHYTAVLKLNGAEVTAVNAIGAYTWTFTAVDGSGYTGSKIFTFTVDAPPTPTNLKQTVYTETTATLTWTENGIATAWRVEYADNSSFTNSQTVDVSGTPTVTLDNLTPDATYYVRVCAVIGTVESSKTALIRVFATAKTWVGVDANTVTSDYFPTSTHYKYALSEQIYTATEIGRAGVIESLDFYSTADGDVTRTLDVYLVQTDKTSFTSGSNWAQVSADDKVFSGSVTFNAKQWSTVTLDTPFAYDGTHNLLLVVDDNSGSYSSAKPFLAFRASSTYSSLYYNNDVQNLDPKAAISTFGYRSDSKNVILIGFAGEKNVTVDSTMTRGTITPDKDKAAYGETVTLTVTPAANCLIDTVSYNDGTDHEITPVNGVYSFVMPNADVTVSATFTLADGFYLNGIGGWDMADINPENKFEPNLSEAGEYMLETVLTAGNEIKVVKVENGTIPAEGWYPLSGDNYLVDSAHAGAVTIYFRETEKDEWKVPFGGYFYIAGGRDPFVGSSVTLNGEIGENFILNLNGMDLTGVSVTFTWTVELNGVPTPKSQTLPLSSLEQISGGEYDGCYKAPALVSAKEMTNTILATVTIGGKEYTKEYSVATYAGRVIDNVNNEFGNLPHYDELKALCEAMLVYGAAAQQQFGCSTGNLASTDTPTALNDAEIAALHENQVGALPAGIVFAGTSLLLKSETTYRLYFTVASGSTLTVTRNGEPLTAIQKGSYWYVDVSGIAAKNILDDVTLVVNGVSCTVSAGDYIKGVLNDPTANATLKNTVTALYRYCKAAEAYFAAANAQP